MYGLQIDRLDVVFTMENSENLREDGDSKEEKTQLQLQASALVESVSASMVQSSASGVPLERKSASTDSSTLASVPADPVPVPRASTGTGAGNESVGLRITSGRVIATVVKIVFCAPDQPRPRTRTKQWHEAMLRELGMKPHAST